MPFFRIDVGYRLSDDVTARILADGIPTNIYPTQVTMVDAISANDNTQFEIEAIDLPTASGWAAALKNALTTLIEYTPVPEEEEPLPTLDVWAQVGSWTKSIGNATTTISGLSSAPKGVILWGSGLSGAAYGTFNEAGGVVFGFSDGTLDRDYVMSVQDNVSPSNANRSIGNVAFHLHDPTGTDTTHISEDCTVSFGATSFDLNWSATTLATVGFYYVFGGNDITNVEVKDFQFGTTSTGDKTYSGLSAKPDFGLILCPDIAGTSLPLGSIVGAAGALHNISAHATSNNTRTWCTSVRNQDNNASSSTFRLQRTGRVFNTMSAASAFRQQDGEWKGWTSDGFTINWIDSPDSSTEWFTGLFVQGGYWDAGALEEPETAGTVRSIVTPVSGQVQGVMGFSINSNDITANVFGFTHAKFTIGGEDSAGNRGCLSYSGNSGFNPSQEATVLSNNKFMRHITAAATASSSVTAAECVVSDMATDGEFTVDYTTADGSNRQVVWFALSK